MATFSHVLWRGRGYIQSCAMEGAWPHSVMCLCGGRGHIQSCYGGGVVTFSHVLWRGRGYIQSCAMEGAWLHSVMWLWRGRGYIQSCALEGPLTFAAPRKENWICLNGLHVFQSQCPMFFVPLVSLYSFPNISINYMVHPQWFTWTT